MAIGENGPGSTGTVHGIVFANFKSGLYCANLPFGNATTICFPLGDQQAQLQFTKKKLSTEFTKKTIVWKNMLITAHFLIDPTKNIRNCLFL